MNPWSWQIVEGSWLTRSVGPSAPATIATIETASTPREIPNPRAMKSRPAAAREMAPDKAASAPIQVRRDPVAGSPAEA
jgi:hypothetical protein